jgi:hypothetical protein
MKKNIKYSKVIIWGYPLYSHTHSYVHHSYYKGFKHLGYDVFWFHDNDYPVDFDFNNCLFIGEGFADNNIPINNTSCYMIMYCPSPVKYINAGRYIDVRMAAVNFKDHLHDYSLDKNTSLKLGPGVYFVPKENQTVRVKNDYVDYEIEDYDKLYISWATNLLPHEFNEEDIYLERENVIHYSGSISPQGVCENMSNFRPFMEVCKTNGIDFIHNDPWSNPLSNEEVIRRTKLSILGVDIRGPQHVKQGLLTCRVFKNISYGHLGLTNSEEIYKELEGNCVYNSNVEQLFYDGMSNRKNYDLIKKGMQLVKENHTYINRINSLLSLVE